MAPADELLLLLDRRVAALRKARPDLEEALALQEQLIRAALTSARPPAAAPFPIPNEHLSNRLREGVPLLHDQPLQVDVQFAADLFSRIVNVLQQRDGGDERQELEGLIAAATTGAIDPQHLFAEAFVQHHEHLADLAEQAGVDDALLTTLSTQAVAPVLRAYAERLLPMIERFDPEHSTEGALWQRGYCPVCGGWPALAELRGVELARFLRCAACGSGWRARRLACPYCGNDDYRSLQTLTIENEQRFRVSVCENCRGYVKVANAFDPLPGALLALDDVASLPLDVVAIERGYQRPVGTGFHIELAVPDEVWVEEFA
jgi:FdhE protein